jgi:uncharacterized membrane protein HdeD (DUF308 family)
MDTESLIKKSNPLRSDLRWEFVLIQGVLAVAIGLYALFASESARNNIVLLIGLFLLINGLTLAIGTIRRGASDPMAQFRLLRAGFAVATGLIVVLNRLFDFMDVNPTRVIAGIGLLGIGVISLAGIIVNWGKLPMNTAAVVAALLFSIWGISSIYQAANDANSSRIIGWVALVIGGGLIALAFMRRQGAAQPELQPTA